MSKVVFMKSFYWFLVSVSFSFGQTANIEELRQRVNSNTDTVRFLAYSDLIWELKDLSKVEATSFAIKFINEAQRNKNKKWLAQAYNDYGIIAMRSGNLSIADTNFRKSLKIRKELKLPRETVSSLSKLGNICVEQGKYDEAIHIYLECAKVCEEHNYVDYLAAVLGNISSIYSTSLNRHDLALAYAKKALSANQKSNNVFGNGVMYSSMGNIFSVTNELDSAVFYLNLAKKIFFEKKAFNEYCTSVNNLGHLYKRMNKIEQGISEYKEAARIARQMGDSNGFVIYETNLAAVLTDQGKLEEAEAIYLESVKISELLNNTENLLKIYRGSSVLYTLKGNANKALEYLEKYIQLNDTVFSKDVANKIGKYQTIYETEKKESRIKELNLKNELIDLERRALVKQRTYLIFLFLFVFLFVGMFIYFLSKIKKSKAELIVQQKINDAGFKAEQIERERIARELHDGVGQKLSVMTMQLSLKQPNLQLATELANNAIVDIRTISHNLLPANIRLGIISTVLNFVEEIKHSQSQCNITVEFDEKVKEIVMTEQRTLNIFRIIQEFVQNSLKYSAAKNIIIKFIIQNNKLELNLIDDGIGFDLNQVRDKNGIGLKNIQSRLEQLNGSIQMNSKKDMGTHFIIKLINE